MHITEGVSKNYPSDSNFGFSLKHEAAAFLLLICYDLSLSELILF